LFKKYEKFQIVTDYSFINNGAHLCYTFNNGQRREICKEYFRHLT